MLTDITYKDWSEALDATVEQLLWEAGVCEPPVDAYYLALELGLTVTQDLQLPARAQIVRVAGRNGSHTQPTIVLGEEERFERRQFAVAHELGEFAAVRVFERLGISPRTTPLGGREQVANALAGRLLLPRRWFHKLGLECDWDLIALRDKFWTASHELIARRMLDMPPRVVVTVFDLGSITWRRCNFASPVGGLLDAEYEAWNECHQCDMPTCREVQTEGAATAIRCWPVHEPDWRREILRTEVTSWE
jgi:hypothetical protein